MNIYKNSKYISNIFSQLYKLHCKSFNSPRNCNLNSRLMGREFNTSCSYFNANEVKLNRKQRDNSNLTPESVLNEINECTLYGNLRRSKKLHNLWENINKNANLLTNSVQNAFLRACIVNNLQIDYKTMLKLDLDKESYNLLINYVCELNNVDAAMDILSIMKVRQMPIDEIAFNALLLASTANSGLVGRDQILALMKSAKIPETINTHWSIARGLARRQTKDEFLDAINRIAIITEGGDENFCKLLIDLGVADNHEWINASEKFTNLPRTLVQTLDGVCVHLVQMKKFNAAYFYYKFFNKQQTTNDESSYAKFLLKEMLWQDIPESTLSSICHDLIATQLNVRAFYDATEIALRHRFDQYVDFLFGMLPNLKPHFFWPLFVQQQRIDGEAGILRVLRRMKQMNVAPDQYTLEFYVLNRCDLTDFDAFLQRFENDFELTLKTLLTPTIAVLLKQNRVGEARKLCERYDKQLNADTLINYLPLAWRNTSNSLDVCHILKQLSEHNATDDWCGVLLEKCLRLCAQRTHFDAFLQLIKMIRDANLKISNLSYDHLRAILKQKKGDFDSCQMVTDAIEQVIDGLVDVSMKDNIHIKHPKHMNVHELECHLDELRGKNMETRGVLRKLIQAHVKEKNFGRVEELRTLFKEAHYEETAGMLSAIFYAYIQSEQLNEAKRVYNEELKMRHATFHIDSFKIIDFARLMVDNDRVDEAVMLLVEEEPLKMLSVDFQKNCWRLLQSAKTVKDALELFDCLLEHRYCKATNIILGPIVKIHLKTEGVESAVTYFEKCVKFYQCTPLQLELLMCVLDERDEKLLQRTLRGINDVHGDVSMKMALLAALAECGMTKALTKFLLELDVFNANEFKNRCERWIDEQKDVPFLTIIDATARLPNKHIDESLIYLSALKVYNRQNDCAQAITFWRHLEDTEDLKIAPEFYKNLLQLLRRCKYKIPAELMNK